MRRTAAPLRAALGANAAFSLACAAALVAAPHAAADALGLAADALGLAADAGPAALRVLGAALAGYAGGLIHLAAASRSPVAPAGLCVLADAGWVVATAALAALMPGLFSPAGWAIAAAVAATVAVAGVAQAYGIGRALALPDPPGDPADPAYPPGRVWRICVAADTDAPPDAIWPIIRDAGGIARHAPFLAGAEILGHDPAANACTRACRDHAGRSWREDIRLDDARRVAAITFHADDPGFPFPFAPLRGGWRVDPAPGGSRVAVWWDAVPRRRLLGLPLAVLLSAVAGRTMPGVIASMRDAALAPGTPGNAPGNAPEAAPDPAPHPRRKPRRRLAAVAC